MTMCHMHMLMFTRSSSSCNEGHIVILPMLVLTAPNRRGSVHARLSEIDKTDERRERKREEEREAERRKLNFRLKLDQQRDQECQRRDITVRSGTF